jgi:PglZ domain
VAGCGVTVVTTRASLPVLRELIDEARGKNYDDGVLGVRAAPEWPPATRAFTHGKVPVRIAPCVSALAVREALLSRAPGEWLIVLTDRSDEDLGTGVLSHLIGHRLRTPDPWAAVRNRFAATGIDPALYAVTGNRDVATELLAATPSSGWPPAPGGVLTRDHAFAAVAAAHLGLTDPIIDMSSVLAWAADPALTAAVSDLRSLAGDQVTDAVLDWAAGRTGAISPAVLHLLRGGEAPDVLPLGLVTGLLADARDNGTEEERRVARDALIRLEPRTGGTPLSAASLTAWAAESSAVVTGMLRSPAGQAAGESLLARADKLLATVRADGLAEASDLLPSGLTRRFAALATELQLATSRIPAAGPAPVLDPDHALVASDALARVERAWARVAAHQLIGADDRRGPAFHAAVRLTRWLAAPSSASAATLPSLLRRHADTDAWADSAVNDAASGVSDPELGAGLAAVLAATRARRAAHDIAFATALAAYTRDDLSDQNVLLIENLLPEMVMPLARQDPVLLLVLDGMSAGVGAEVTASILARPRDGWAEALLPGQPRRAAALAALPTVTDVSRASLLCGQLRTGGRDTERSGFAALADAHDLRGAPLFHKGPLDSARPGYAVADDVATAIVDVTRNSLVTCVLNTVDDALDRSDAGGIAWSADTVKHLAPLLDLARHAGRIVILTADHGHIVERRQGTQRPHPVLSSSRSRAASTPAGDGEMLFSGPRVLTPEGTAVLAVDENLRYGPLKSGYHGGASPAEAVVPVIVLVPGAVPADSELRLAPPQEPSWWTDPILSAPVVGASRMVPTVGVAGASRTVPSVTAPSRPSRPAPDPRKRPGESAATLFDISEAAPEPSAAAAPDSVAAAVLKSQAYIAHKKTTGRVSITDAQVRALLETLLAAPSHRLAPSAAAAALGVAPLQLRGAVLQAQQSLNIDGYPVVRVDADGATVILDGALLAEQYGIRL